MNYLTYITVLIMAFTEVYAQNFSNPDSLFDPTPYGFSHVATLPAKSQFVFVAGQGGEENQEGLLSPDFRRQVRQALKNIEAALRSQNMIMRSVVKITTLVVDHDANKLKIIIEEFEEMWPDKKFPVNTLIPVSRLALENMLIEIDAVAIK